MSSPGPKERPCLGCRVLTRYTYCWRCYMEETWDDRKETKESTSRALVPYVPPLNEQVRAQYENDQLNAVRQFRYFACEQFPRRRTMILYDDVLTVKRLHSEVWTQRHFRTIGQSLVQNVSLVIDGFVVDQQWSCEQCHRLTRWGPICLRCTVFAGSQSQKPGPKWYS